ncbi:MAG: hypothetical protein P8I78_08295 [Flavobacterium sp.]|nr:hypothetical protein [Flavobacterium sp.]|tara:strand:+ start:8758 stop:9279 length:522 start_codon:yes stop_codon:yes gene_type:complete
MDAEVKIISKHNLDCTSLENLAKDISNRLGWNVEFGQYHNANNELKFIVEGLIEVSNNGIKSTLYKGLDNKFANYNYCLELGDQAILIYDDFIDFMPVIEIEYEDLSESFINEGTKNNPFLQSIFAELQKLGADKIYLIKDTFTPELAIPANAKLEAYIKSLQQNTTFIEAIV